MQRLPGAWHVGPASLGSVKTVQLVGLGVLLTFVGMYMCAFFAVFRCIGFEGVWNQLNNESKSLSLRPRRCPKESLRVLFPACVTSLRLMCLPCNRIEAVHVSELLHFRNVVGIPRIESILGAESHERKHGAQKVLWLSTNV